LGTEQTDGQISKIVAYAEVETVVLGIARVLGDLFETAQKTLEKPL
jgi:hypothetical protein